MLGLKGSLKEKGIQVVKPREIISGAVTQFGENMKLAASHILEIDAQDESEEASSGQRLSWVERKESKKKDKASLIELGFDPKVKVNWGEIKKAYRNLSLKYHPDKHVGSSEESLAAMNDKFNAVSDAYRHLELSRTYKKNIDLQEQG